MLLARLQPEDGGAPQEVALRFSYRPGTGVRMELTDRPDRADASRSTSTPRRS